MKIIFSLVSTVIYLAAIFAVTYAFVQSFGYAKKRSIQDMAKECYAPLHFKEGATTKENASVVAGRLLRIFALLLPAILVKLGVRFATWAFRAGLSLFKFYRNQMSLDPAAATAGSETAIPSEIPSDADFVSER